MNTFKTTVLLTLLTLMLVFAGEYFGGENGAILAFAIAAAMNFVSYFYSDKIALAMYRAQPVTREQLPRAYEVVERLTAKAGIPMPKIFVIPTESPNAFATGRNPSHATVAVTHGILALLTDEELEGVLAHELSHVRNRDILTSSIAATLAGAITILARMAFWFGGRHGGGRRWSDFHAAAGAAGGHADSAMGFAHPRVRGRCDRRAFNRQSLRAGQRSGKNLRGQPPGTAGGLAQLGAPVHCGAIAFRRNFRQPLQHPPAPFKSGSSG